MSDDKSGKPHIKLEVPFGEDRVLLHTCCAPCSGAIIECLLENGIRPTIFYCNPNIWPEEEYLIRKNECTRFAEMMGLDIVDDDYDHEAWLRGMEKLYSGENGADVWKILSAAPERGERCLLCFKYRLLRTAQYAVKHGFRVMTTTLASSRWKSIEQINEAGNWAVAVVQSVGSDVPAAVQNAGLDVSSAVKSVGSAASAAVQSVGSDVPSAVKSSELDAYAAGKCIGDRVRNVVEYGVNHCKSGEWRQNGAGDLVWWEQNWRKGGLQERRGQLIKEYDFYNQRWCGCEFSNKL